MKTSMKFWIVAIIALTIQWQTSSGQKIDEDRMNRDIEVAENVLATLIKGEINQQRVIFGFDVKGSYQPGYGITFRLPSSSMVVVRFDQDIRRGTDGREYRRGVVVSEGNRYTLKNDDTTENEAANEPYTLKDKADERRQLADDSVREEHNNRIIRAAQDFILDYGDLVSQLAPEEKIIVTNQSERPSIFHLNSGQQTRISVEGVMGDITALKQGKITREQALKKLTVVSTETVETRAPDLEMLSSIFSRLYRPDLSKTYFVDGNVYYERLKDYGAVYYMQMVSSIERGLNHFYIPTVGLDNVDRQIRDKKVAELYPQFEKEMKENMLEYGRTLKSLGEDEILLFKISLTKCEGCGIPSTLELSIPASVLKAFGGGKIDRPHAMGKFTAKKGASQ